MKTRLFCLSAMCVAVLSCQAETVINRVPVPGGGGETDVTVERDENTVLAGTFNIRYYNTSDTYTWAMRRGAVMDFSDGFHQH